jgi:hypothetical protein
VTGVDLLGGMLAELRRKHADRANQIRAVQGVSPDIDFGRGSVDIVLPSMALHHHPRRREDGSLVYGDCAVEAEEAAERMARQDDATRRLERGRSSLPLGAIRRVPGETARTA